MTQSDRILLDLSQSVGGDVIYRADAASLVRHLSDYGVKGTPDPGVFALAYPRNTADVAKILAYCNERRVAVQPQGGMTGLSGGAVPITPCVILSLERMRIIKDLDLAASTITVQAGVTMEAVQRAADAADLFFPLDLGGRGSCQIGGNLSTNAGGNRVLRFGMARDLVLGLEAVLPDGTIIDSLHKVIKNNTGYDLKQLFIGAEGTLGVITTAVLRLFPKPRSNCTGLFAVDDYAAVLDLLHRARSGFASQLTAFEVMWPSFYDLGTRRVGRKPPLEPGLGLYVLIETLGTDQVRDGQQFEAVVAEAFAAGIVRDAVIAQSQRETADIWSVRDAPGEWQKAGHWPQLSFDVSVPTGEIGELVQDVEAGLRSAWPDVESVYFGHVADGNLHLSVSFGGKPIAIDEVDAVVYAIVSRRRGSISAEHGIGLLKKRFLHLTRSPAEVALMHTLKQAIDPNGILNPGKIF
jgi:FAD/FMN-containing dehydrogenase